MNNFTLSPLFRRNWGFDRLNDLFDDVMHSDIPHYPPYNIEKRGDNEYRVVIATAGFKQDDLDVSVENHILTITGKSVSKEDENQVSYLHKGMTQREFKLSLRLDEHTEVVSANYDNGLLSIDLKNVAPEEKQPQRIDIQGKKADESLPPPSNGNSDSQPTNQQVS